MLITPDRPNKLAMPSSERAPPEKWLPPPAVSVIMKKTGRFVTGASPLVALTVSGSAKIVHFAAFFWSPAIVVSSTTGGTGTSTVKGTLAVGEVLVPRGPATFTVCSPPVHGVAGVNVQVVPPRVASPRRWQAR
jgi:hypothetical protein